MFHPWGCPRVGQQGPHLLCPPGKSPPALTVERCPESALSLYKWESRGPQRVQPHQNCTVRAEVRSQAVSLWSTRFRGETHFPGSCDSVMCIYSQSPGKPDFTAGWRVRPDVLWPGSSSVVPSDADVEGAGCKEERSLSAGREQPPFILLPNTPTRSPQGRQGAKVRGWGEMDPFNKP